MLDQNAPSINFEQVTNMLNQVGQVYEKVLSDISKYQYEHQHMRFAFSDHRSQLASLERQFTKLNANLIEQLTDSSARLSKFRKSSRLQRYLTPYGRGNNLSAANEPPAFALAPAGRDMVDRELKEEQKRKKRRSLRG